MTLSVVDQAVATPKKLVEINCGVIIDLVKCETNTMKYLLLWVIDMQHAACSMQQDYHLECFSVKTDSNAHC